MDLKAQYLSETCSDPIEFLNQLRQTTEPIGGGTAYSEDGELVEYDVAIEAVRKANNVLEVKEVDLDKEITDYLEEFIADPTKSYFRQAMLHFFELGLKAQKGE